MFCCTPEHAVMVINVDSFEDHTRSQSNPAWKAKFTFASRSATSARCSTHVQTQYHLVVDKVTIRV